MQDKLNSVAASYQVSEQYTGLLGEDYISEMVSSFLALHEAHQRGRPLTRLIEKLLIRPSRDEARELSLEIAHNGLVSVFRSELQAEVCGGILELTRDAEERRRVEMDLLALGRLIVVARELARAESVTV